MKSAIVILALMLAVFLPGCFAPTRSTVREFDLETGAVVRETVTSESVVKNLTDATKEKTVIVFDDGWAAYISVSTATLENPTPTGKMFAGRTSHAYLSLHPEQQNTEGIAQIIQAIRSGSLTVGADGVQSEQ